MSLVQNVVLTTKRLVFSAQANPIEHIDFSINYQLVNLDLIIT